jgi:predicted transcriptional regulator of viral defense system
MHGSTTQARLEAVYRVAAEQAGYFTSDQARSAGLSYRQLTYHTQRGRFERVALGLYRLVLFPPSSLEDLFAAVLLVGPMSVVSHDSALALYELSDVLPAAIHLTVPRNTSRRHQGVKLHRNRLRADEITRYAGLPVTTPARTLADMAAVLDSEQALQAIAQALDRGLATKEAIAEAGRRRGGRVQRLLEEALLQEVGND